jgi:glycosyltransferase involved in cell wall biosynthesis
MSSEHLEFSIAGRSVLIVSPDWPWPANYAARIDVLDHIKTLASLGLEVDLLVTAGPHDLHASSLEISKKIRNIIAVRRYSGILDYLGLAAPGQVFSRRGLRHVKLSSKYDYVLLEGSYVSEVLKNHSLNASHRLLRINNDEAKYFFQLARTNISLASIYYLSEGIKFFFHERKLLKSVDNWLVSSHQEYTKLLARNASKVSNTKIFFPPRVDIDNVKSISGEGSNASKGREVLFLGTLLMKNNTDGLDWYLNNVHPKLLSIAGYSLTIAGHAGTESQRSTIQNKYGNLVKVNLVMSPTSTDQLYLDAAVFINPMRFGAGIKLKTVHALAAGVPVVSTSVGAEGTQMFHGEHLLISDDPSAFADQVSEILLDPSSALPRISSAMTQLQSLYDQSESLRMVLGVLLKNRVDAA